MANLIAGWFVFWLIVAHTLMLTAPVVADAYRVTPPRQHVCPMLHIKHGVGSDLRTFTMLRDVCGSARLSANKPKG